MKVERGHVAMGVGTRQSGRAEVSGEAGDRVRGGERSLLGWTTKVTLNTSLQWALRCIPFFTYSQHCIRSFCNYIYIASNFHRSRANVSDYFTAI